MHTPPRAGCDFTYTYIESVSVSRSMTLVLISVSLFLWNECALARVGGGGDLGWCNRCKVHTSASWFFMLFLGCSPALTELHPRHNTSFNLWMNKDVLTANWLSGQSHSGSNPGPFMAPAHYLSVCVLEKSGSMQYHSDPSYRLLQKPLKGRVRFLGGGVSKWTTVSLVLNSR